MCGIAGIFRRDDTAIGEAALRSMREDLTHRGPDDAGLHIEPHVGLAFRRLAIIDLSPAANQPMASAARRTWIIFNGEIYNFMQLREELERKGRRFRTRSDTEVVLEGYEEWGTDIFARLNGMFAIALWDRDRQVLHLVRDRVGKKPLFYRDAGGGVIFASEVRALLRGMGETPPVDQQSLDHYLTYLCVPGDRSIFKGVRKVPPACVVSCSMGGTTIRPYWRLSFARKQRLSERQALDRLDEVLADATRLRMISDVPLGAFLSGGVDSSTIVAMMCRSGHRVKTFSVGVTEEAMNELPFARAVAQSLGADHTEIRVEPDAAAVLPRLVWHYGEPFADASAVPTFYVSQAARREVTVVLNGDGGDEAFAGYQWHRSIRGAEIYRRMLPGVARRALSPVLRGAGALPGAPDALASLGRLAGHWGNRNAAEAFWIWPGFSDMDRELTYSDSFKSRLAGFDPRAYCREAYASADGAGDLDRALQVGTETYLPDDLLVKVDIASMANSLEARSPFLDYRVLEFAAALPASLKVRRLQTKYLLKKLASRLVPPLAVYRRKQGFAVPIAAWLRGPLRKPLEVLLGSRRFSARGFFDAPAVNVLNRRHQAGEDLSTRLWALLWLELWFRMFIDGDVGPGDSLHDLV